MSSSVPVIEETSSHQVLLSQCAWCGAWRFGPWFVRIPGIGKRHSWTLRLWIVQVVISHGICPPCAERTFGRKAVGRG
jgi:hypothetical protein